MRGEYGTLLDIPRQKWELPPRARRIHLPFLILWGSPGTTSACAENTPRPRLRTRATRNYLRVRGEYLANIDLHVFNCGTTSACAENTRACSIRPCYRRNYLRVRGEYSPHHGLTPPHPELPPRARRIPFCPGFCKGCAGTTSACAENTACNFSACAPHQNYLRVRGEYQRR